MIQWFQCSCCDHCCCINLSISTHHHLGLDPILEKCTALSRERHLFSIIFNLFICWMIPFSHLYSGQKSGSPHGYFIFLSSSPTIQQTFMFYLIHFSGNCLLFSTVLMTLVLSLTIESLKLLQEPLYSLLGNP